jgi:hypothetical protein
MGKKDDAVLGYLIIVIVVVIVIIVAIGGVLGVLAIAFVIAIFMDIFRYAKKIICSEPDENYIIFEYTKKLFNYLKKLFYKYLLNKDCKEDKENINKNNHKPKNFSVDKNKNNPKEENNKFKHYMEDINYLKIQYQSKEEIAKKVIKERFPPPQLTYDRFMDEINMWREIFLKQTESTLNIINIAPKCTPKIGEELKNRLDTLESIVEKMEELVVELAINLGNSSKKTDAGEVKELLTEMQNVIDSVKKYDY